MINSIGLQNAGVDHAIQYELKHLGKVFHKKVIANVAATDIEGYVEVIKKLNSQTIIAIYEINVSCPNIEKGCMKFDEDPRALAILIKTIKKIAKKPIYIKLSPRVTDIVQMAKVCEDSGADGLVLINTMPGMRIDLLSGKPIMANKVGGMSGPAIKPIAVRAIYLCRKAVKIPIIGCGGVSNASDVIELMYAGANAVQVGSENLIDPYACQKIIAELPVVMKKYKIKNIKDIIGFSTNS
jgi:dihydroorotate dehydrogenase (NAD+) catalytic subunit